MNSSVTKASGHSASQAGISSSGTPASRGQLAQRARELRYNSLPLLPRSASDSFFKAGEAPAPTYVPPYGRVAPRDGLRRAEPSKERDAAVQACVDKVMKRIDALPAGERIRAKVGQMIQYAYEAFTGPERGEQMKAFEQRVREGQVSSFLYAGDPNEARRYQRIAVEESPLGIPLLFAWDVIHGMRTMFPIPLAMAASWNPQAAQRASEIAGREAAEDGQHWTFAPMVDIARDPRWGRIAEGAGEDQFLGSRMAEAQVRGFNQYVLSCAKHFAAYGAAEGGRDYNTTDMSLRRLHDVYLPPFHAAAKAGADTFMTSFNDLNGVPSTANPYLLREVLRQRFGSKAMVVTDWASTFELLNHGVARTRAGAAIASANAGVDMEMVSGLYAEELAKAVHENQVPESTIDEACRRVLRLKAEMGLFDDPYGDAVPKSPIDRKAAREVAEDSIVLLRNEGGVLPLKPTASRIALIGKFAETPHDHIGSWRALGKDDETVTVRQALEARAAKSGGSVNYVAGNNRDGVSTPADIEAAVQAAKNSDVIVVAIGENADRSGEASSVQTIELPGNQRELVKALLATGKPVVALLMNGRPMMFSPEFDKVPALVETWQLGSEHGTAVANVLFGDRNPSGKLPVSFPARTGQIPVHHQMVSTGRPATFDENGKVVNRFSSAYLDGPNAPKFRFGFGLSYTTFDIGQPRLSAKEFFSFGEQVCFVDVPVKNTGKLKGKETVQIYSRWEDSTLTQPMRKLQGFAQVELEPGESKIVRIAIPVADLAVHDNDGKLMKPSGL
ncbi:MAG TPA: glycoside hydrolase family 3 N-terminal domain-containing protein, partial [Myxococcota bacterium]|nr:glycoside hydrolase family 3 N-terminal domain-containing protein [Myxococcota bacterium]